MDATRRRPVSPHHGRLTVMEGAKSSQPRLVCRLACIFAMALMVSRSSAALLLATARLVGVSTALVPRPTLSVLSTSCAVKKRALSFEISNINMPSTRGQLHRVSLETTTATVRRSTRRTLVVTAASSDSTEEPGSTVASTPRIKRIKKEETVTTTTTVKVDAVVCSTPDLQNTPKSATKRKTKSGPEPSSRSPPPDFESIYSLVEELRADRTAPVDHSGSEALPEKHRGDVVFRFQVLIALMLSSQTKDGVVGDTMRTLQQHGLDLDSILATSHEDLNSMIGKVGFHNNKTKYIKQTAEILKRDYGGDIPPDASEIMKLPGVGPKMAFIIENVALNKTSGIGIDTHMHRMFNELRWVKSKNPEQTRVQLESWLPDEYWGSVNVLWVGLGQEVQQFKPKIIEKALKCSRPADALRLLKRLGVDIKKEGEKLLLTDQIRDAMSQ